MKFWFWESFVAVPCFMSRSFSELKKLKSCRVSSSFLFVFDVSGNPLRVVKEAFSETLWVRSACPDSDHCHQYTSVPQTGRVFIWKLMYVYEYLFLQSLHLQSVSYCTGKMLLPPTHSVRKGLKVQENCGKAISFLIT